MPNIIFQYFDISYATPSNSESFYNCLHTIAGKMHYAITHMESHQEVCFGSPSTPFSVDYTDWRITNVDYLARDKDVTALLNMDITMCDRYVPKDWPSDYHAPAICNGLYNTVAFYLEQGLQHCTHSINNCVSESSNTDMSGDRWFYEPLGQVVAIGITTAGLAYLGYKAYQSISTALQTPSNAAAPANTNTHVARLNASRAASSQAQQPAQPTNANSGYLASILNRVSTYTGRTSP